MKRPKETKIRTPQETKPFFAGILAHQAIEFLKDRVVLGTAKVSSQRWDSRRLRALLKTLESAKSPSGSRNEIIIRLDLITTKKDVLRTLKAILMYCLKRRLKVW